MMENINTTSRQFKLTKEDVFGHFDFATYTRLDEGLVVARSDERCPIFNDVVPYKSETVVFRADQEPEVLYWLEYVNGSNCVSARKVLEDGRIALRANYMCW